MDFEAFWCPDKKAIYAKTSSVQKDFKFLSEVLRSCLNFWFILAFIFSKSSELKNAKNCLSFQNLQKMESLITRAFEQEAQ